MMLRAASNYTMQWPGGTAIESKSGEVMGGYSAFIPSIENAYTVGSPVVREIVKNWDTYCSTLPQWIKPNIIYQLWTIRVHQLLLHPSVNDLFHRSVSSLLWHSKVHNRKALTGSSNAPRTLQGVVNLSWSYLRQSYKLSRYVALILIKNYLCTTMLTGIVTANLSPHVCKDT